MYGGKINKTNISNIQGVGKRGNDPPRYRMSNSLHVATAIITIIFFICTVTSAFSQTRFARALQFGSSIFEMGYSVVQTTDGGYAVAGWSTPYIAPDLILLKYSEIRNSIVSLPLREDFSFDEIDFIIEKLLNEITICDRSSSSNS